MPAGASRCQPLRSAWADTDRIRCTGGTRWRFPLAAKRISSPPSRGFDMDRSALAASILKIDGIVLLVVAAIHLSATPLVLNFVSSQSTAAGYAQIKPLFLLSFTVVGILLIPIGLSTFFCANPIRRGDPLARSICCFNAIGILMLPVVLILTMPVRYFSAIPFLTATILVSLVAILISAPLALVHSKPFSAN